MIVRDKEKGGESERATQRGHISTWQNIILSYLGVFLVGWVRGFAPSLVFAMSDISGIAPLQK